jgi:hypothetical protein
MCVCVCVCVIEMKYMYILIAYHKLVQFFKLSKTTLATNKDPQQASINTSKSSLASTTSLYHTSTPH